MARVRIFFVPLLLAGCSSVLACGKRVERAPTTNTTRGVESPPSTDRTYDLRWSPSRVGACSPEANVSPALAHAGAVAAEVGQVMLEPAVAFLDETLTFVQRNEVGEASIEMPWHGLVVEGQGAAPRLYDDGTHGDRIAGDGLFTRACLSLDRDEWRGKSHQNHYDAWVLDPALRGSERTRELALGVRVNDAGFFISLGDVFAQRRVNDWALHGPEACTACAHAWSLAGDVFDFFSSPRVTRSAVGVTCARTTSSRGPASNPRARTRRTATRSLTGASTPSADAEIVWFTRVYREYASATRSHGDWALVGGDEIVGAHERLLLGHAALELGVPRGRGRRAGSAASTSTPRAWSSARRPSGAGGRSRVSVFAAAREDAPSHPLTW